MEQGSLIASTCSSLLQQSPGGLNKALAQVMNHPGMANVTVGKWGSNGKSMLRQI
jgi:hypothetical protein